MLSFLLSPRFCPEVASWTRDNKSSFVLCRRAKCARRKSEHRPQESALSCRGSPRKEARAKAGHRSPTVRSGQATGSVPVGATTTHHAWCVVGAKRQAPMQSPGSPSQAKGPAKARDHHGRPGQPFPSNGKSGVPPRKRRPSLRCGSRQVLVQSTCSLPTSVHGSVQTVTRGTSKGGTEAWLSQTQITRWLQVFLQPRRILARRRFRCWRPARTPPQMCAQDRQ